MILRRAVTLRSDSWKYNLSARSASVSVSTVIVIERQTRARMPHALRCRLCSRTVRPAGCQRQSARAQAHGSVPAAHKQQKKQKKVIVIGSGWAGFGAAKHLAQEGLDVHLIDGAENPGGLSSGWRNAAGQSVEAGIKGFWYQYHNIFALLDELGIQDALTDWETSGFWSPEQGLTIEAPVFSSKIRLPTMLGQFVHTLPLFRHLSLADRATMVPLLAAVFDFEATPAVYESYDRMSARELFQRYGVSDALYQQFLKPLLLVGMFATPEELSAATMLETFYFYTLAHQADFDIKWCRGSVAEKILLPLADRIRGLGATITGSTFATGLVMNATGTAVQAVDTVDKAGKRRSLPADAVVFAVGINGMKKLVAGCPALASRPEFRAVNNLRSIDAIAARLWFDRLVPTLHPANVLAGFYNNAGGTYFNLNALQDEYRDATGTCIAADVYHANELLPLRDEEIVATIHRHLATCEPAFAHAQVVESAVLRFPGAVTHFSPGSHSSRPLQTTSYPNVFMAGDWVKGVPHGANGLSQERAYVTGLRAATLVTEHLQTGRPAVILDTEPDEPHLVVGKTIARTFRQTLERTGLPSLFL